jgi:hypothetical protein
MKSNNYICFMPIIDNFLQQGVEQIRQSIVDIDESYNNEWDILAELIQNSVDSIKKTERPTGQITLSVNCQKNQISIADDGIGIDPEKLPRLLRMFGTDKRGDEKTIGEKGVGLKFVIFSSDEFYLKTATAKGASEVIINNALNWKNGSGDTPLPMTMNEITDDFKGTIVALKKVPDLQIFQLSFSQLVYILRTKTAIGNTHSIWNQDEIDISIFIDYTSQDGLTHSEKIPFKYLLPTEGLPENSKIDIQDYYDWIDADKTDHQKRIKLRDKIIIKTKNFEHTGRTVRSWTCFVPKRKVWDIISQEKNLATEENLQDDIWLQNFGYSIFRPGIFTSVKGSQLA